MRKAGGYADLTTSYEAGKPELVLDVDRGRAADLGISSAQIGRSVAGLLAGFEVATFEDDAGAFRQADAEGFIRLNALRFRVAARRRGQ